MKLVGLDSFEPIETDEIEEPRNFYDLLKDQSWWLTHEILTSHGLSIQKFPVHKNCLAWMSQPFGQIDVMAIKKDLEEIGWREEEGQEKVRISMVLGHRKMRVLIVSINNDRMDAVKPGEAAPLWRVVFSVSG